MLNSEEVRQLLEQFCPMVVFLDVSGRIRSVGPTLQKLRSDSPMKGSHFLEHFELLRPRAVTTMSSLMASAGGRLRLRFRDEPRTAFKGIIVPLPDEQGAVLNLSFGISILDAVRDYGLSSADFSATDLAIEMLYLVEAKSAAMEASRSLNQRLQDAMIAAEQQAFTDTLTGLGNRRTLDHMLSHLVATRTPFSLLHLDLDFFKSVNDRLGHAAGDFVLQQVARAMIKETRDDDIVARIGGDEFVLIFKNLLDKERLATIAGRLIERLQEPIPFEGDCCRVSGSVGIALSSQFSVPEASKILRAADEALYEAKRAGRSEYRFFKECDEPGSTGSASCGG